LLGQAKIVMVDKSGSCDNIQEKDFSEVARTVKKSFFPDTIDLESDKESHALLLHLVIISIPKTYRQGSNQENENEE
jgi:hypothetical protein